MHNFIVCCLLEDFSGICDCRYWGEERGAVCSRPTLDSLHELAEQRAADRRRREDGGSKSQACKEDGRTEKRRGKRKKRESERDERDPSDGGESGAKRRSAGSKGEEGEGPGGGVGPQTVTEAASAIPISRSMRESQVAAKPAVHRQLPEWIQHPITVQPDILAHSVPLAEVPLSNGISRNLQKMGVVKLFPIQVGLKQYQLPSQAVSHWAHSMM